MTTKLEKQNIRDSSLNLTKTPIDTPSVSEIASLRTTGITKLVLPILGEPIKNHKRRHSQPFNVSLNSIGNIVARARKLRHGDDSSKSNSDE
jgi:hypothetical protein